MKKHVVFDLFGVIFNINLLKAINYVGWISTIKYIITTRKNPIKEFFALLDKMRKEEPGQYQDLVAYQGTYLPVVFCDWLKGYLTTEQTLLKILTFLEKLDKENYFKSKSHKHLIEKLFHIMADSQVITSIIYESKFMKKLIKNLIADGHSCYILSNIDIETHQLIEKKFPEIFSLFQGQILSCDVHFLKPQKEIYLKVHENLGLKLENCLYIDDQLENIIAAHNVGMQAILMQTERDLAKKIYKKL